MKVPATGVSAAQPQVQSQQASQVSQPSQPTPGGQIAKQSQQGPALQRDEFVPRDVKKDLGSIIGQPVREKTTLDWNDRVTASGLSSDLSSRANALRLAVGEKTETVTQGRDGTWRGPEGQPLVEVELKDGNTAYVDPNTNQYYLTNDEPNLFGQVHTLPAADLPEGSQFSNSHFSDADVKAMEKIAADGSPLPGLPHPHPEFPPRIPELPRPPIDWSSIIQGHKGNVQG